MVTILRLSREMMILVLPVYINPTPQRSIPHYSSCTIKQKSHPTVHPCYALSTKDMKTTRNWGKDFPSYFLFAHIPYYCKCYNIACTVHCSVNSVHTHMYNNWETECTLDWLPVQQKHLSVILFEAHSTRVTAEPFPKLQCESIAWQCGEGSAVW